MAGERYRTFGEFWPYYLGEHARGSTRVIHFVGT
ncbi:MAG TPA: Mpo1-like protein, partial [Myxococcota bacterium]|nr:Mpo1-like protein [Myxococcota bacterium]